MLELNLRSFIGEFNGSKFLVYFSLLLFTLLLALRLDGVISVSFIVVFLPIWIGEAIVFAGFIVGLVSFVAVRPPRTEPSSRSDFFSMCFQTLEHILLLMFQILLYLKIEQLLAKDQQPPTTPLGWLLVFFPLFVQSFMAMIISIWCIRHEKPFEFELFFAVNIVQFVFIAFKLDNGIYWNWTLILVPTWVLFSLFLLCSIYSLIIALFLNRTLYAHHQHIPSHRRPRLCANICHVLLSVPLLIHLLLLAAKLDALDSANPHPPPHASAAANNTFLSIGFPLQIALLILLALSFGNCSGNVWWFGMRKPFCNFLFEMVPCLQYYANISYKFGAAEENQPAYISGRRQTWRQRMRQSQQTSGGASNSIHAAAYGIEEATTSWIVSSVEEQRIIVQDCNTSPATSSQPEQSTSTSRHKGRKEKRQRHDDGPHQGNSQIVTAQQFVRGSIESPD